MIVYKIPKLGVVDYETYIRWYYDCMPELAEWLIKQAKERKFLNG